MVLGHEALLTRTQHRESGRAQLRLTMTALLAVWRCITREMPPQDTGVPLLKLERLCWFGAWQIG